jgi:hypothetical protein
MTARIVFNGQEYDNPDEMPPQVRKLYERAMENLPPNQQANLSSPKVNIRVTANLRFKYNGQIYNSLDELPPEVRPRYEKLASQMDKDRDGIPDFLEEKGDSAVAAASNVNAGGFDPAAPIAPLTQINPVISPDSSLTRLLLIAGVIIALLLGAVILLVAYIYLH